MQDKSDVELTTRFRALFIRKSYLMVAMLGKAPRHLWLRSVLFSSLA
jgi:hypothetical protein